jgi:hypothetical protein
MAVDDDNNSIGSAASVPPVEISTEFLPHYIKTPILSDEKPIGIHTLESMSEDDVTDDCLTQVRQGTESAK